MDNLIDSIESSESPGKVLSSIKHVHSDDKMTSITQDTKKKCSSIKNLAFGSLKAKDDQKEVKITSV